jgi:hypothetical protein
MLKTANACGATSTGKRNMATNVFLERTDVGFPETLRGLIEAWGSLFERRSYWLSLSAGSWIGGDSPATPLDADQPS